MKKVILAAIIVCVILGTLLYMASSDPMIICNTELPDGYSEAIEAQSQGVYSDRLPLIPVYTTVDGYSDGRVYYTIHYFPFGTVEMSYSQTDGYNIEKPLTGL